MCPCLFEGGKNGFPGFLRVFGQAMNGLFVEGQQCFQRHGAGLRISFFIFGDLFLELSSREFPVGGVEGNPFCLAVALEDGIVFFRCRAPVKMVSDPDMAA